MLNRADCLLIMLATVCAVADVRSSSLQIFNVTHSASVEIDLPWFIQFAIPIAPNFEPLSLRVRIAHPSRATINEVELLPQNDDNSRRIFRNVDPVRFKLNDVINGELVYTELAHSAVGHQQQQKKRIAFHYVIKNKQFDVLQFNVETTFDPKKAVASSSESDETDDIDEEHNSDYTGNDYNPMEETASDNSPNQHDVLCIKPGSMNAYKADNEYLTALLSTALQYSNLGKRLILTGRQPPGTNAAAAIRELITDKLRLPQFSQSILQANFTPSGLLFELATPRQKLEVMTKASMMLKNSDYKIENTDSNFYDVSLLQRGDFNN